MSLQLTDHRLRHIHSLVSWWTFRIFFIFFCPGVGEKEEAEEVAGGVGFN